MKSFWGTALVCAIGLSQAGCLTKIIRDGTIASTRKASVAVNTIADFEVAERIAFAGLGQMEGFHYLDDENSDALFLLTRSWASVGLGFIEDAMERAEDEEGSIGPNFDYHKRRAIAAYTRAVYYGIQLLEQDHPGFQEATRNAQTMRDYAAQWTDKEDAENLFWVGYAQLGKVNAGKDKPEIVGELHVAVALLERSVALDETYFHGSGHVALGAYHARNAISELDEAKKHFDRALEISQGKTLLPKVQYALRYHCAKQDKENYVKLLNEVLASGDTDPYQRLPNTIAKRKAKRHLDKSRMEACGF
jgi:tetratricopeptide (TPR) repeat protein